MALVDTALRTVQAMSQPIPILLHGSVKAGDPLYHDGTGFIQADANAGYPCSGLCALDYGDSGDYIMAASEAVIQGFATGTVGGLAYLSDTAGKFSETASTTSEQVLGLITLADTVWFAPHKFGRELSPVNHSFAAAGVADIIHIATQRERVRKFSEVHATVAGQAGTLTLERLQGTEAPGSGDDLLGTTKVDLTATINTVQSPALTATVANLVLEKGDRLALKLASGAATSLANACATVELERA